MWLQDGVRGGGGHKMRVERQVGLIISRQQKKFGFHSESRGESLSGFMLDAVISCVS